MALGRKSIVRKLELPNSKDPKNRYVVLVQANKNHGICDILLVTGSSCQIRLTDVLSTFQGRQFDDTEISDFLWYVLNETLNPTEE